MQQLIADYIRRGGHITVLPVERAIGSVVNWRPLSLYANRQIPRRHVAE